MNKNNDKINPPVIILSHPQMGENIGAAARAMLNFGITEMRIINPRDGWPNERAEATASGALGQMNVTISDDLPTSIADMHFVFATTARNRDMVKPEFCPKAAMIEAYTRIKSKQNIAFIFGAEQSGLTNNELTMCQAIVNVPTNPDFSSINLAQSVLLLAYEWSLLNTETQTTHDLDMGDSFPAKQDEVNKFIGRLENELEEKNFFRSEGLKPTMQRNIRNIFSRSDITDQELRTLHGVLSALRGNKSAK